MHKIPNTSVFVTTVDTPDKIQIDNESGLSLVVSSRLEESVANLVKSGKNFLLLTEDEFPKHLCMTCKSALSCTARIAFDSARANALENGVTLQIMTVRCEKAKVEPKVASPTGFLPYGSKEKLSA